MIANLPLMHRFLAKMIPKLPSFRRSKTTVRRSQENEFEKRRENSIFLRTIGGGYMHRNNVVVGTDASRASEGASTTGIIQQRSVHVDFDDVSYGEVGPCGNESRAQAIEA